MLLESQQERIVKIDELSKDNQALNQDVMSLKTDVQKARKDAEEYKTVDSVVHLTGYAATSFSDRNNEDGSFDQVSFNPIFHYSYKDLALLESELEFETEEDGATDLNLEYLAVDLFLHDYVTLQMGKFLSPIGQFRQNLHPAWINKLPDAPVGFGHDGAAPLADIGVQVRGGAPLPLGSTRINYSAYVANGPELIAQGDEIHAIETEGFTRDVDGNKVGGGRLGFFPTSSLELGFSYAFG